MADKLERQDGSRRTVVMFAQTPPPEHGQSRMVQLALDALAQHPERFEVIHVNARFSSSLDEIGEGSATKLLLIGRYLYAGLVARLQCRRPLLYYVPGPVKWSAVLRDWLLLTVLRLCYHRVVFHWHAIGHGEWANGSQRLHLPGPAWLDRAARVASRWVLAKPLASIAVSPTSDRDSHAVAAKRKFVVYNGIEDPCVDYEQAIHPLRLVQAAELASNPQPIFKLLFLAHGTREKGLFDILTAFDDALKQADPEWRFQVTFAGGIGGSARNDFEQTLYALQARWGHRFQAEEAGYLGGAEKRSALLENHVFLAPSRWESFGLAVAEAMAYGMPVVAAASDGVTGVLPPGYPFVSPIGDSGAFAANLLACCRSLTENSGAVSGVALRARFYERFRIGTFAEGLVDALWHACGEHGGKSAVAASSHKTAIRVYLADQNPGFDRSIGISRMTQSVMTALDAAGKIGIETISSRSSQQGLAGQSGGLVLPWSTRSKWVRFLTDHLHPLFQKDLFRSTIYYFPKGYLPWLSSRCHPSVVTIHDTIIQHDKDHYPRWRSRWEYGYWAWALKHTLHRADRVLTISLSSKRQIEDFMSRYRIPAKRIEVTYEPCGYENLPQPENPLKGDYVMHLGSREPHKRTAQLVRWWHAWERDGRKLPPLHLIGSYPREVAGLLREAGRVVRLPFLADANLQDAYRGARALVLPSEIEGFGLPALEAYYLGTPVCFVKGTSVEEILGVATSKGGFELNDAESLFAALEEVLAMSPEEVRHCGLKLREAYAAEKVAERMLRVFEEVAHG